MDGGPWWATVHGVCQESDMTQRLHFLSFHLSQFSSFQLLSCVWLFATRWITAHQASLSITNSQSLLKLMLIELVMPSSHLILCYSLLLLPPIPPSIRVFSSESALLMRSPKYWSFSFSWNLNTQDWSPFDGLVGSPCSLRNSQQSSPFYLCV